MCVECQDDCDCGVNQFCGIDKESPRTIPSLALSQNSQTNYPYLSAHVDKISKGVEGMKIKSKCYDYRVDGKTCPRDAGMSAIPEIMDASPLEYQNPLGTNVFSPYKVIEQKARRYPAKSAAGSFCGQIDSWAPKSREWVGSPTAEEEIEAFTGIEIHGTPASCTKQVKVLLPSPDTCDYMGQFLTVRLCA